jgi:mannose-1-phosphate guanylyltransferase
MIERSADLEGTREKARFVLPEAVHVVAKPWGREIWWAVTDRYLGKRIEVRANHMLSLQYHREKLETLYLLSGRVRFHVDGEVLEPPAGSALTIFPGSVHRIEAVDDVVLFEVSTPHPDDVVRLDDRYGRISERRGGPA